MMKPWIWLRVAAIVQAVFTFGHTAGGIPRRAIRGPQEQAIFDAMQAFRFDVMGTMRSHWDFYQGFGLTISVNLAVLAVLIWQLGSLTRTDPEGARPLLVTLLLSEILIGVLSWRYFFAGPVITSVVVTICLAVAFIASYRSARIVSQVVAAG
jgi:hypothetical protein